ncbi:MAG: hypothetical protein FWC79_05495 [Oscillospiraceae bacterium]|nr:hypothetical protein [Oscillospiraceae bacterium]
MKDRTIQLLEESLENSEKKNATLTKEIQELAIVHHKYNSKLNATNLILEKALSSVSKLNNTEIANELSDITSTIKDWSKSYAKEVESIVSNKKPLPKTNIISIDLLFEQLHNEAISESIDFDLNINCSINSLIDNNISKDNLEFLIGDHIKDAIIAIKSSKNTNHCICVTFDIVDNAYEFNIYDSGIEFDIDTLVKLGLEPITTYKSTRW